MTRQVELTNAPNRNAINVINGVKIVIVGADKNVVYIQKDTAVGLLGNGRQNAHSVIVECW